MCVFYNTILIATLMVKYFNIHLIIDASYRKRLTIQDALNHQWIKVLEKLNVNMYVCIMLISTYYFLFSM